LERFLFSSIPAAPIKATISASARSNPAHQQKYDEYDDDDADDTHAAVAIAVTVTAETAAKAAKQEDHENDDEDKPDRHGLSPAATPPPPIDLVPWKSGVRVAVAPEEEDPGRIFPAGVRGPDVTTGGDAWTPGVEQVK
jgi:hypothetical protein